MSQQPHNLLEKFQQIVSAYSEKVAIVDANDQQFTYHQLDVYSNQIALMITQMGVPSNQRIGISVARSYDTIASMLAVIKLGCTYVPLANDLPKNRVIDIFEKAQLVFAIVNKEVINRLPHRVTKIIDIDSQRSAIQAMEAASLNPHKTQTQPANIIFTSGTINSPKGVFISQEGILNLISAQNYAKITSHDVFLQLSPFEFDGATVEMWGTLLNGAKLVLMPVGYPVLSVLAEKIATYKVTLSFITTQLFNLMVDNRIDALDQIDRILTGGEEASVKHMLKFLENRKTNRLVANIYGPAECTTFSTFYPVERTDSLLTNNYIPIGKPINGVFAIVVDQNLKAVADNTLGELLIGGKGVSTGYLDMPAMTKEKFVNLNIDNVACSYFYRTGDKVFKDSQGDIVFVGRYDNEIKVRGYRILPEEIEKLAMQYIHVSSAALLITKHGRNDKYAELFIVVARASFEINSFKNYLRTELPGYIQVNRITVLQEMPLKKIGKIDYAKLKEGAERDACVKF